jgi:hypothetical protein
LPTLFGNISSITSLWILASTEAFISSIMTSSLNISSAFFISKLSLKYLGTGIKAAIGVPFFIFVVIPGCCTFKLKLKPLRKLSDSITP